MDRRRFLHFALSAVALPTLTRVAAAQSYPTRSLRIVVGFTPGRRCGSLANGYPNALANR
jgi:hypothetical protein